MTVSKVDVAKGSTIFSAFIFDKANKERPRTVLRNLIPNTWYKVTGYLSSTGDVEEAKKSDKDEKVELNLIYITQNIFVDKNKTVYLIMDKSIHDFNLTDEILISRASYNGYDKFNILGENGKVCFSNLQRLIEKHKNHENGITLYGIDIFGEIKKEINIPQNATFDLKLVNDEQAYLTIYLEDHDLKEYIISLSNEKFIYNLKEDELFHKLNII